MSILQGLLDFSEISADFNSNDATRNKVFEVLRSYKAKGPVVSTELEDGSGYLFVFVGPDGGHWILRSFPSGHVSLDISSIGKEKINELQQHRNLEKALAIALSAKKSRCLPPVIRKGPINPYLDTSDSLLVEYDIDRVVADVDSEYQNIKILHSNQYGNILILDNDINLAESDLSYTKAITGNGRENFDGKTVLILGGGDGGILNELLKQQPKLVVMAEIDKLVVDLAVKHLRGICGDAMDNLTGANYEVIIGDCVEVMDKYIKQGNTFDYIINDLTAIPITTEPRGSQWDFLRLILDKSMIILTDSGKYFTQGNSYNRPDALKMYEDQLGKLSCSVAFNKETICVPSYHEQWVFYEIWKTQKSTANGAS